MRQPLAQEQKSNIVSLNGGSVLYTLTKQFTFTSVWPGGVLGSRRLRTLRTR